MKFIGRSNLQGVRTWLRKSGAVVAEVDRELRYVWIDNSHPDFDPSKVVGRRDDELIPAEEAAAIMEAKRKVLESETHAVSVLSFPRSEGVRSYSFLIYPIQDYRGKTDGLLTVGFPIATRTSEIEAELAARR